MLAAFKPTQLSRTVLPRFASTQAAVQPETVLKSELSSPSPAVLGAR